MEIGSKKSIRRCVATHSIVAEYFLGSRPTKKHQINHKDGNKRNNHYWNLEYSTAKNNVIHSYKMGLIKRKLSVSDVRKIVLMSNIGFSKKEIAEKFNIKKSHVSSIISGTSWSYITGIKYFPLGNFGENSTSAILTEEKVKQIRKMIFDKTMLQKDIAIKFGVSRPTITDIKNRKSWAHV